MINVKPFNSIRVLNICAQQHTVEVRPRSPIILETSCALKVTQYADSPPVPIPFVVKRGWGYVGVGCGGWWLWWLKQFQTRTNRWKRLQPRVSGTAIHVSSLQTGSCKNKWGSWSSSCSCQDLGNSNVAPNSVTVPSPVACSWQPAGESATVVPTRLVLPLELTCMGRLSLGMRRGLGKSGRLYFRLRTHCEHRVVFHKNLIRNESCIIFVMDSHKEGSPPPVLRRHDASGECWGVGQY